MIGTERICRIVNGAYLYGLCEDVTGKNDWSGDCAVKIGNIVLTAGHHARGNTCHIYIENGDERLEVYGITSGNPGWTETYGWLMDGKWVPHINKILDDLEEKINKINDEIKAEIEVQKQIEQAEREDKIKRFNALF